LELNRLKHLNMSFLNIDMIPDKILKLKELKTIDVTGSTFKNSDILKKLFKRGVKVIS